MWQCWQTYAIAQRWYQAHSTLTGYNSCRSDLDKCRLEKNISVKHQCDVSGATSQQDWNALPYTALENLVWKHNNKILFAFPYWWAFRHTVSRMHVGLCWAFRHTVSLDEGCLDPARLPFHPQSSARSTPFISCGVLQCRPCKNGPLHMTCCCKRNRILWSRQHDYWLLAVRSRSVRKGKSNCSAMSLSFCLFGRARRQLCVKHTLRGNSEPP